MFVKQKHKKTENMTTINELRSELKSVQKQINILCNKPLHKMANEQIKAFYLRKLSELQFLKIDLLDQIVKIND
jgi:hypothetical protein